MQYRFCTADCAERCPCSCTKACNSHGSWQRCRCPQALSSIGRLQPDEFADHAEAFVAFVVDSYLFTDLPIPEGAEPIIPATQATPTDAGGSTVAWTQATGAIGLKCAALKAAARALVADADASPAPAEAAAAAQRLVAFAEQLLDPASELAELGAVGDVDGGHLRLAAASALLRLARRHDSLLSPQVGGWALLFVPSRVSPRGCSGTGGAVALSCSSV